MITLPLLCHQNPICGNEVQYSQYLAFHQDTMCSHSAKCLMQHFSVSLRLKFQLTLEKFVLKRAYETQLPSNAPVCVMGVSKSTD
jgi:hypothetical protein